MGDREISYMKVKVRCSICKRDITNSKKIGINSLAVFCEQCYNETYKKEYLRYG